MNMTKVKVGDYYSRLSYGKVLNVGTSELTIENEKGESWDIGKKIFENEFKTHNQFEETVKLTKTELANIFLSNARVILTVNFNKQVKEKDVVDQLVELYPNKGKIISEADYKKKVKELVGSVVVGEERTMVGRHNGSVDEFGRVHFVDMEATKDSSKEYDTRMRLVDPRTINWLVVDGKKYELK
jgi:hypothetical protein